MDKGRTACLVAISVLVAVSAGYLAWDHFKYPPEVRAGSAKLERAYSEAKAAGAYLREEDLPSVHVPSEQEDATPILLPAARQVVQSAEVKELFSAIEAGNSGQVELAMASLSNMLDLAEAVSSKRTYCLGMGGDPTFGPRDQEMAAATLGELLIVRSLRRAGADDEAGALSDLAAARRLALLLGAGCTISGLVEQVKLRMALTFGVSRLAHQWAEDASLLERLKTTWEPMPPPPLRDGFKTEQVFVMGKFMASARRRPEEGRTAPIESTEIRVDESVFGFRADSRWLLAEVLGITAEVLKASQAAPEPDLAIYPAFKAAMEDKSRSFFTKGRFSGAQLNLSTRLRNAHFQSLQTLAFERSMRGLLAAMQYRASCGQWPATLEQAGHTEMDPFTGMPLSYALTSGGVKAWSLSLDKRDDKGRPQAGLVHGGEPGGVFDIAFSFPATKTERESFAWLVPLQASASPDRP